MGGIVTYFTLSSDYVECKRKRYTLLGAFNNQRMPSQRNVDLKDTMIVIAMYHHKQYCRIISQKTSTLKVSVFDSYVLFSVVNCSRLLSHRNQVYLLFIRVAKKQPAGNESHNLLHHFSCLCCWATCTCACPILQKKANYSNNKAAA